MKINQKKVMVFLFFALCANIYSKNLDTPSVYDESKVQIADWKVNVTDKDLNKDGKIDKLLVYYKATDSKVSVEYVPYLNDGSNNYIKSKTTQKDFDMATFAADYKLYTNDYIDKFNQKLGEDTDTNKPIDTTQVPEKSNSEEVVTPKIETKADGKVKTIS